MDTLAILVSRDRRLEVENVVGSPQCQWPGGCKNKVRVEKGPLCQHHRRFIGNTGHYNSRTQLPAMARLAANDPQRFQGVYEMAGTAMDTRPRVTIVSPQELVVQGVPETSPILWDGKLTGPGESIQGGDGYTVVREGTGPEHVVRVRATNGNLSKETMHHATVTATRQYQTEHATHHQVHGAAGESYNDEAEAIAQLEMGSEHGGTLTVMDPDGAAYHSSEIVTFKVANMEESFAFRLQVHFPGLTQEGEVLSRYIATDLRTRNGQPLDERRATLMNRVVAVRNIIHKYGIRSDDGSELILPVGWSEREPDQFVG